MPTVNALTSGNITNATVNKQTWGGVIYNVKAYGALGDGTTDNPTAIQSTIDIVILAGAQDVYFPAGSYIASGLTNTDLVNFVGDGANFIDDTYYIFPYGTQAKSQKLGHGQNSGNVFISTNGTKKQIGVDHTVLMQTTGVATTQDGIDYDKLWGFNTLISKWIDTPDSYVVGIESSIANETTNEAGVIGVLSSYVGMNNGGTSAFESTGNTPGWLYGLKIDGIKTTGTGITLYDAVSSSGGMNA